LSPLAAGRQTGRRDHFTALFKPSYQFDVLRIGENRRSETDSILPWRLATVLVLKAFLRWKQVFLPREDIFPPRTALFLSRTGAFLFGVEVFLLRIAPFPIRTEAFLSRERLFLFRVRVFLLRTEAFLFRIRAILLRKALILFRKIISRHTKTLVLCRKTPKTTKTSPFLPKGGVLMKIRRNCPAAFAHLTIAQPFKAGM
jgi:hypothetical protein